ncbi:MAG TPA: hypothetical protein VFM69_07525 [Pricia sp.]|nr:hypothetical protein [Pricia sp.]
MLILTMQNHFELSEQQFELKFEEATFNPNLFNHEAHMRLVWIHINKYGLDNAIKNICSQLSNFVTRLGARDKYNKTLTIAAIKAVYHFMLKSKVHNFKSFITEFPRLKTHFKEIMDCHYSNNIYTSEKAKKEFVEPDLLPFD